MAIQLLADYRISAAGYAGIDAVEQFVVAPLSAEGCAHIAARHVEQWPVQLALEDLFAGVARRIETAGKDAVEHGRGIGSPEYVQRRRRVVAGKRRGEVAIVEFLVLLISVMILSGGAIESQVPLVT